jgi:hypothetical protein
VASDRRLRTTNSPRTTSTDRQRRRRTSRIDRRAGSDAAVPRVVPRPDGIVRSVRTFTERGRLPSTRRVVTGTHHHRDRWSAPPRWRPYAPSAVAPLDIWGTDRTFDDRPLAQELTTTELAREAMTALRIERSPTEEEPWLLDMAAPPSPMPSGPRHAAPRGNHHRHLARPSERSRGRRLWIAVVGAAVAVAVAAGWSVALAAGNGDTGADQRIPVPIGGQSAQQTAPKPAEPTEPEPAMPGTPQPTPPVRPGTESEPTTLSAPTPPTPLSDPAAAVVSALESGDPGFGWPSSVFGTPGDPAVGGE